MIKVQVRPNEPVEAALRRFKRQCNYAGIFRLAKKYSFFEKRSEKKRREDRERIRNIQRAMRRLGHGGGRRRKIKMRSSSVTPESARRAAEESANEAAASAPAPQVTETEQTVETPIAEGTTVQIGNAQATVSGAEQAKSEE